MDIIQGILIILLSFWVVLDQQGLVVVTWFPIMVSLFVGLIMGIWKQLWLLVELSN